MIYNILAISIGAVFGALSRYFIFLIFEGKGINFPYQTLLVNLIGCFLIGILFVVFETKTGVSPLLKLFLVVGFLGSFTTFSSFAVDNWVLIKEGLFFKTFLYLCFSVIGGMLSFFIAVYISNLFIK